MTGDLQTQFAAPPCSASEVGDSERLDWLERTGTSVGYNVEVSAWGVDFEAPYAPTVRGAIDAGMAAEREVMKWTKIGDKLRARLPNAEVSHGDTKT